MTKETTTMKPGPAHASFMLARAFALFLGGFALLNSLVGWLAPGGDANLWWISFGVHGVTLAKIFLPCAGLLLLGFGFAPRMSDVRRKLTLGVTAILAITALLNGLTYCWLLFQGRLAA